MFIVKYKIKGYEKQFSTEPYKHFDEAVYQKNDIASFEGVYDAEIVPIKEDNQ